VDLGRGILAGPPTREPPKRGNISGILGASIQDRAVQESMGPLVDRTKEHLGTSDKAVMFYRRLPLKKLREMDEGKPLPAQDPALDYRQRACSYSVPADRPWQDVFARQQEYEQRHLPRLPRRNSAAARPRSVQNMPSQDQAEGIIPVASSRATTVSASCSGVSPIVRR
jgi:LigXa C-terminal domain like